MVLVAEGWRQTGGLAVVLVMSKNLIKVVVGSADLDWTELTFLGWRSIVRSAS